MRKLVLLAAAVVAMVLPAAPAWAHTSLVSSSPARNAVLPAAPTTVALTFSQKLNPDFTTIVLSDPAQHRIPAADPVIDQTTATIALAAPPPNGVCTVAYRVVSADGHTVQGSYTFTVADPSRPAAGAPSTAAAAPPTDPSGGMPPGLLVLIGVAGALLATLAAYFAISGRRRAAAKA